MGLIGFFPLPSFNIFENCGLLACDLQNHLFRLYGFVSGSEYRIPAYGSSYS